MILTAGKNEDLVEPDSRWTQFLPALGISIVLHGLILMGVLTRPINMPVEDRKATLAVKFYTPKSLPLKEADSPEEPPELFEPNPQNLESEIQLEDQVAPLDLPTEAEQIAIEVAPEQLSTEYSESGEQDLELPPVLYDSPRTKAPSVLTVQESLRQIRDSSRSQLYSYSCNPLEEEAGIKDCSGGSDSSVGELEYRPVERNLVYRALNPTRELSRSERSLNVVSTQSRDLAERVSSLELPTGLSDYVLQEVEAGITHNADLGNRTVQHMIDSTDKSAAGAMARDLLSDPWVLKQEKLNRQRQVRLPK
ncbi:MAG: hypothetical protein AB8B95_00925 [Pseudohongiellaceae bacterium]